MESMHVWVFTGEHQKAAFPSAVFSSKENAEYWIKSNGLSGTLTKYPINISVYDWAIQNKYFVPKNELQKNANIKSNFTSAYLEHYHYENGT